MRYRLLAVDLDGTLLRRDGQVDERDIAAIRELRDAGAGWVFEDLPALQRHWAEVTEAC